MIAVQVGDKTKLRGGGGIREILRTERFRLLSLHKYKNNFKTIVRKGGERDVRCCSSVFSWATEERKKSGEEKAT